MTGKPTNPSGAGFSKDDTQNTHGINPISGENKPGKFKVEGDGEPGLKFNNTSNKKEKFNKSSKGFGKLPLTGKETDDKSAKFPKKNSHGTTMRKEDEEKSAKFRSEKGSGKLGGI